MVRIIQNRLTLSKISIALNIIFLLGSIFIIYKFYPNIKSKFFSNKQPLSVVQEVKYKDSNTIPTIFYNASEFEIIGKLPHTKTYTRLPYDAEKNVRKAVWQLSKNSAGISVRFSSNSTKIKIRWTLNSISNNINMNSIAVNGFDLYSFEDGKWQFVGVAEPNGLTKNEAIIIEGMGTKKREYLLNLPLYNGVSSLKIGIDKGAYIGKSINKIIDTSHPIVFYGTSITQGASVSRPGLTYSALLERHFNQEVINLGFSGNGRFEKEIGKYIMTSKPSVIVMDCTPNSTPAIIRKNLPKLLDYIHSINDTIPIIFVESIIREFAYFKKDDKRIFGTISFIKEQNKALKDVYDNYVKKNKNLMYVINENLIGQDHEATKDGIHFNDLGHYRAYERFQEEIEKHLTKK